MSDKLIICDSCVGIMSDSYSLSRIGKSDRHLVRRCDICGKNSVCLKYTIESLRKKAPVKA